ncbi:molecular chaperone TorD family protein [Pseudodesulfovibrio thermohalotolerans]|uniref:TorD/DmsD family molecular chaperone n=1 Tax=Pseudodesulfovibrio thermohalotolerans TaxID=2880651 RepID=UPI0024411B00|nr:molecular chaperone TorD family protein [Pseudodesulfovibrio thermohalotolerans]WFS62890.1 molecular chaperone TorD family protein [Pseudodesulfovibrio thermohalotolerans]
MSLPMSKLFLLNLMELGVTVFRGPDEQVWAELATHALPELLGRVQKIPEFPAEPVEALAETLASRARSGDFPQLETEYVRLFIAGPGGIPAPLYESCHQDTESRTMGQSALAMRDRLARAGLEISLDSNEPPDHLTLELEYLFHLCAEEWSGETASEEQAARFVGEVMLPWVRRFRKALADANPDPAFLASADIVVALLEAVART